MRIAYSVFRYATRNTEHTLLPRSPMTVFVLAPASARASVVWVDNGHAVTRAADGLPPLGDGRDVLRLFRLLVFFIIFVLVLIPFFVLVIVLIFGSPQEEGKQG